MTSHNKTLQTMMRIEHARTALQEAGRKYELLQASLHTSKELSLAWEQLCKAKQRLSIIHQQYPTIF